MEKKNQLDGNLRCLLHKHGKLPNETEKAPYSQNKAVKTICLGSVVDIQTEGGTK